MEERHLAILRRHMVEVIAIYAELAGEVLGKAALDERVMAAMGGVPRHAFVPAPLLRHAYGDMPLPIGFGKTISQPFMVAVMTDLLQPRGGRRGPRGRHGARLSDGNPCRAQWVACGPSRSSRNWQVEAEIRLRQLGYTGIGMRVGDGARAG